MVEKSAGKALKLGAKIRRLRRAAGLTQAQLAERLDISPSYLNLIEHNNRNVTVDLLLRLAEQFGLNLADLAEDEEGGLVADLMEVFGDTLFEEMDLTTTDVRELVSATPVASKAVVALYDAYRKTQMDVLTLTEQVSDEAGALLDFESQLPAERVSDFIQENSNHFPDIEEEAERVRRDARLDARDPFNAMTDYMQTAYGIRVAVLPPAPQAEAARRFDPALRTLEISERLARHSRTFQLAHQLGLVAAGSIFDMLLNEGGLTSGETRALGKVALANYFAAALIMPYEPFLESAKALRYDIELLQHHFGTSFEQICHRLTTLQRPGRKGVPFHMLRVDIAGNVSKRFSLSGLRIPRYGGACPRWNVYAAFLSPGVINAQISLMPDKESYFCIARTVTTGTGGYGAPQSFLSIGLGCEIGHARELVYADGIDLDNPDRGIPAGTQCRTCERMDCRQRAFPPVYHRLNIDENVRGLSAYVSTTPSR